MPEPTHFSGSLREWVEVTTHRAMRDQSRYVKSLGLSMPQFFLLMHIFHNNQCGISDLSSHMEITAAAASQTVEKLVQSGLLERTEDPNDRRARQVTLSQKGRGLIEKPEQELDCRALLESLLRLIVGSVRRRVSDVALEDVGKD